MIFLNFSEIKNIYNTSKKKKKRKTDTGFDITKPTV